MRGFDASIAAAVSRRCTPCPAHRIWQTNKLCDSTLLVQDVIPATLFAKIRILFFREVNSTAFIALAPF
jgi:hypothetical protein